MCFFFSLSSFALFKWYDVQYLYIYQVARTILFYLFFSFAVFSSLQQFCSAFLIHAILPCIVRYGLIFYSFLFLFFCLITQLYNHMLSFIMLVSPTHSIDATNHNFTVQSDNFFSMEFSKYFNFYLYEKWQKKTPNRFQHWWVSKSLFRSNEILWTFGNFVKKKWCEKRNLRDNPIRLKKEFNWRNNSIEEAIRFFFGSNLILVFKWKNKINFPEIWLWTTNEWIDKMKWTWRF